VFGLLVFAFAIVLILESELGLSPWDVLNQGLAEHTALSFGMANIVVALVVLCIGWSLGGQLALDLAAALPAGIERLVLIATTPKFLKSPTWRCGTPRPLLARLVHRLHAESERAVSDFLALLASGSAPHTAARVVSKLRAALRVHGGACPEALTAGLARLRDGDLRSALPMVRVPALVVAGQRDRIIRPTAVRALAHALPDAHYLEVAGAAHAPFLSHPVQFARELSGFLHA